MSRGFRGQRVKFRGEGAGNVGAGGGVVKPYVAAAFTVSEAEIAALERQVADLERVIKGQAENRRQEIAHDVE